VPERSWRAKCLLLAHAEGVLGGLSGVAEGLGGRVEDTLALLGGVVVGAGDGVGGLLANTLLAGGLGRAGDVVGGGLDGVTGLLGHGLLGVGLHGGGGLVGGALAAEEVVSEVLEGWLDESCRERELVWDTYRASDMLKVLFGVGFECG
jgi:hypothetical protein